MRGRSDKQDAHCPGSVGTRHSRGVLALLVAACSGTSGAVDGGSDDGGMVVGEEVVVPAGPFWMGCNDAVDPECSDDEYPYHEVTLPEFRIDKTEVTLTDYAVCLDAGRCEAPDSGARCNWDVGARDGHPVNCISWSQAQNYCTSLGRRLPTEAEWEKAARGTRGWRYPWGNDEASCDFAVFHSDSGSSCGREQPTWPVCSKMGGESPYGACDMAGNVFEWVADWYEEGYYEESPAASPTGPASGTMRVLRGGAWLFGAEYLRSSHRSAIDPSIRDVTLGFRCASTSSSTR